jgi:hypothetical protein
VVVNSVLGELDDEFSAMYAATGRPSVPPEQLLKATVSTAMHSIRSAMARAAEQRAKAAVVSVSVSPRARFATR